MNWLWIYWPVALAVIALVIFGVPEFLALRFGGPTFSRFMATVALNKAFGRVWIFLWGLLIGGLAIHFLGWCEYMCDGKLTGG